jgi:hypothetical protein
MTRLEWNVPKDRRYEYGVDRGVLYTKSGKVAPWNGLKSVTQAPVGAEVTSFYLDGEKYNQMITTEEYAGTIAAYTAPDAFDECDGTAYYSKGLSVDSQDRTMFDLSYRTKIGNGVDSEAGYKIHLIYNALALPTQRAFVTEGNTPTPIELSWSITTMPIRLTGRNPSAHYIINTTQISRFILAQLEDILYGSATQKPRMPTAKELIAFFKGASVVSITDNKDGTWTAQGPDEIIQFISWTEFILDYDNAVYLPGSDDTYTLSSSNTAG